jgi:lipid II:glycine glycyltransferase (peptidoglycan interpeptide bridge formation enzyme)
MMNAKTFKDFRRLFPKNLWQSIEWSSFQIALGNEVYFLGGDEVMCMFLVKKLPFGFSYIDMPRGPLGNTDAVFWEDIKKEGKKSKCIFTRISPMSFVLELPKMHINNRIKIFPETTLLLDLTLSEEDILKQMKPKGRYNIRLAQRNNIQIIESSDVSIFYSLLKETTRRDGFSGHNESYYKKMLESLGESVKMYLAEYVNEDNEKVYVAGGIFIFLDDTCTYYYGVSSNVYRNLMAPYLIQWHAISEARKKGCTSYDFLGIAPEGSSSHSLAGVTRFKKQFGGNIQTYPDSIDIIYRPFMYIFYRGIQFFRSIFRK